MTKIEKVDYISVILLFIITIVMSSTVVMFDNVATELHREGDMMQRFIQGEYTVNQFFKNNCLEAKNIDERIPRRGNDYANYTCTMTTQQTYNNRSTNIANTILNYEILFIVISIISMKMFIDAFFNQIKVWRRNNTGVSKNQPRKKG